VTAIPTTPTAPTAAERKRPRLSRRYLLRRLADVVVTLFGVAVSAFVLLRLLPGDEVTGRLGVEAGNLTPTQLESLRAYYGLDQPLPMQFLSWMSSVLQGNFGVSVTTGEPVSALLANALPVTVELALLSTLIGVGLGVPLGVLAATKSNGPGDAAAQTFSLLGLGIPNFVLASGIIAFLSAQFGYFPSAAEYAAITESPLVNLQQQMYPALVLGFALAATVMRTTRSAFLEQSAQDFVRTARGKGLSNRRVRWRHVLHNASIPIVTITGIQLGYLLGGTIVVEQVFGLPGLGRLVLTGIQQREYAVVQSVVLVIAAMFVLVNLCVDLLYARIDPRVQLS
jgi:peptide/nickel transport system permease protein